MITSIFRLHVGELQPTIRTEWLLRDLLTPREPAARCKLSISTCSSSHKGHDDLTSSLTSPLRLSTGKASLECPTQCWQLRVALVLRDLTQHTSRHEFLTTTMHHLVTLYWRESSNFRVVKGCQDFRRSFALFRIKNHAPLLVRVPANFLSFNLRSYSQAECLMLTAALKQETQHLALIVYGVPGAQSCVCYPRRASLQTRVGRLLPLEILHIPTHSPLGTWNSTLLLSCTPFPVSNDPPRLSRGFHIRLKGTACARFGPQTDDCFHLRITAAAGTWCYVAWLDNRQGALTVT